MKTSNKIILAIIFLLVNFITYAQTDQNNRRATGWVISKDVQKFSNKDWLSRKVGLTIVSMDQPGNVISKGVQTIGRPSAAKPSRNGNVVSKGYPKWIISKDVQKIGRVN
jgi:hypothetical protein